MRRGRLSAAVGIVVVGCSSCVSRAAADAVGAAFGLALGLEPDRDRFEFPEKNMSAARPTIIDSVELTWPSCSQISRVPRAKGGDC